MQTNVRPWLIPDEAFESLRNMYVFRGRIRKRFGSTLMHDDSAYDPLTAPLFSRLRINIGTTDGAGNFTNLALPGSIAAVGQMFSVGDDIFTANTAFGALLSTNVAASGTFNAAVDAMSISNATPLTTVYYYPALPVMGIQQNETNNINDEPTYAFDTSFAYQYINGAWERLGAAPGEWTGDDTNFFWATSWRGTLSSSTLFFATNFKFGNDLSDSDPLKYWDGANWNDYTPQFNTAAATNVILTARIVLPFKDRLILLNVVENTGAYPGANIQYGNRCRFSQNGDPIAPATSFLDDVGGRGGYIDAATQEQIISAEFLKDRLIVFFESSTWELVYTGNEILPFRWQKINTELGVESTFSIVPFDQIVMGVGNVGIHSCNGASVQRIDDKIPDLVFNFKNSSGGVKRVQGVRDYYVEHVYWTFPSDDADATFPTQVLVYDYKNGNWAINDDSITAFGYFQNQVDRTWESSPETWQEADFPWGEASLSNKFRQVLAGNQEGFLFVIDAQETRNAGVLQITDISGVNVVAINHNLAVDDYIAIENVQGATVVTVIQRIISIVDEDNFTVSDGVTGTYTGGGTIARVSNPTMLTKQYNFFNEVGTNMSVNKVDFMVDKTEHGEFTVQVLASSSPTVLQEMVLETSPYAIAFYPLEQSQARLWHSIYPNLNGEVAQLNMTFSDDQMRDPNIAWSALQIHAMLFNVSTTSSRFE